MAVSRFKNVITFYLSISFVTLNWFQFAVILALSRFDINSYGNHQTTLTSLCNRLLSPIIATTDPFQKLAN